MRTAPLGTRRPSKGPRFGALSVVGIGVGAISKPDSRFKCAGDSFSVRAVEAKSSKSWNAGLKSRGNGPRDRCRSNAPDMVRGLERCPVGARGENTTCWCVCGPSPAEEGVGFIVEGGPINFDRSCHKG